MRMRTLLAIVLMLFALPALASDPFGLKEATKANPDTLVAIADVQADAIFDERTKPESKDGLLEAARKNYQKAIQVDPKHKDALRGMARLHARLNEREKAMEIYKQYFALYPKDVEAAHDVALAHARWKDWPGAVAWCETALKIDPENQQAKKTLGFCLAMGGNWDGGFATLCQVMSEAQARHNIAGLLNHVGNPEAAKQQLQLARKLDPNFTRAKELLGEIEKSAYTKAEKNHIRDGHGFHSGAVAVEGKWVEVDNSILSVCYEGWLFKIPSKDRDLLKRKLTDGDILTAEQVKQLLRQVNHTAIPELQAVNGHTATNRMTSEQFLTSSLEATKVKGQTVIVPKNKPVEIGSVFAFGGKVSADKKSVDMRANLTRTWIEGDVELVPLMTPIGAAVKPGFAATKMFMEQHLEVADVRSEKIEKQAVVPVDHAIVLPSWTEAEEVRFEGKKTKVEFTVIPVVMVRVKSGEAVAKPITAVVPQPLPLTRQLTLNTMMMRVPRAFIAQSGLNVGGSADAKSWTLSPREMHMLTEFIRGAKERGECDVLSRPQLLLIDGQSGFVQVGEDYSVSPLYRKSEQHMQAVPMGLKAQFSPKVSADRNSVSLAVNVQFTEPGESMKLEVKKDVPGAQFPVTEFVETPVFNTWSVRATETIRFGESLVLASSKNSSDRDPFVTLVIVTPSCNK